ncbi:integrase family protein [Hoeflea sp. CAU 1731]
MPNKLTKSVVDRAHPADRDYFRWDSDLKGFGIKISNSGRKTYVCKYRIGSGRSAPTRRYAIGAHGSPRTVDQARAEARRILGRAANGVDPAQEKQNEKRHITVTQLCDLYFVHGTGTKKPSTEATDRGRVERHIKLLLGKKNVRDVTRADINPRAIAILKLLMFTGMRKREIETLRWSEVDSDRGYLRREDSKTGQKSVPLSAPARQVISEIPALEGSTFMFPLSETTDSMKALRRSGRKSE